MGDLLDIGKGKLAKAKAGKRLDGVRVSIMSTEDTIVIVMLPGDGQNAEQLAEELAAGFGRLGAVNYGE